MDFPRTSLFTNIARASDRRTSTTMDTLITEAIDFILDLDTLSAEDLRSYYERTCSVGTANGEIIIDAKESSVTRMRQSILRSVKDRYSSKPKISQSIAKSSRKKTLYDEDKKDIVTITDKNVEIIYLDDVSKNSNENSTQASYSFENVEMRPKENSSSVTTESLCDPKQHDVLKMRKVKYFRLFPTRKNADSPQGFEVIAPKKHDSAFDNNSIKLARRSLSHHSVFESCSTYDIFCANMTNRSESLSAVAASDSDLAFSNGENLQSESYSSERSSELMVPHSDSIDSVAESETTSHSSSTMYQRLSDDYVSLGDSFFAHQINGDPRQPSPVDHKSPSDIPGLLPSQEDQQSAVSVIKKTGKNRSRSSSLPRSEKKRGKKSRKRHKKRRPRGLPTFECPKCGVCYVISSRKIEVNNRCLHCDLWTGVEPEFLKMEKHSWNTCTMC